MKNNKILLALLVVLAATWGTAFYFEPQLPEQIPTHWNAHGEVDGYTSKPWGVYMLPLISTLTSVLVWFLPLVSPKGFKLDQAKKVYQTLVLIIAVFMFGVMMLTFMAGMGRPVDVNQWIMAGIGTLFVSIGNYLSKVPKNFFLGIRTPWTLASDEVWYKTHRLGSWIFVVIGLITLIGAFVGLPFAWFMGMVIVAALIPIIYSLVVYKQIEGFGSE